MSKAKPINTHEAEALVRALYRSLLRREADPGGLRTHVGALLAGASPASIAENFIHSGEFPPAAGNAVTGLDAQAGAAPLTDLALREADAAGES